VPKHFVRMTNFSRGILYFSIALPIRISEIPYILEPRWSWRYVRIKISSVPSLNSSIPGSFQQWQCLIFIQYPFRPCIGSVRHASKNCHQQVVIDYVLLTRDTFKPLLPKRTYFILASSAIVIEVCRKQSQSVKIVMWEGERMEIYGDGGHAAFVAGLIERVLSPTSPYYETTFPSS